MKFWQLSWFSFGARLFLLHIKKYLTLLFLWVVLFGVVGFGWGAKYGIPYLFLDPEYLGEVGFWSFFITGLCLGAFIVSWNLTAYILHSARFPFLATLDAPFFTFCINNSLIPFLFVIVYLGSVIHFQLHSQLVAYKFCFLYVEGLILGFLVYVGFTALYFYFTNKNIIHFSKLFKKLKKGTLYDKSLKLLYSRKDSTRQQLQFYITPKFRFRRIRPTLHYEQEVIQRVFNQNHKNGWFLLAFWIIVLVVLGWIDIEAFKIPAAASILILMTLAVIIIGWFNYFAGNWSLVAFILFALGINHLSQYELFDYSSRAYGLDYNSGKASYSLERIEKLSAQQNIDEDILHWENMLTNWKVERQDDRPPLVLINFSGGGLRAAVWGMRVVQVLNQKLDNEVFEHTFLMTGASGGMMAAAYLRELYDRERGGDPICATRVKHLHNLSQDYINSMAFQMATNDVFYSWQTTERAGFRYLIDRSTAFEDDYNSYTGQILNKTLKDYGKAEWLGKVPVLLISPSIINDHRKLIISAQPVSFFTRPLDGSHKILPQTEIDGIDFQRFFANQNASNLLLTSAIRMNAAYPYVFPKVYLPSEPPMRALDAGMRDNYGFELSYRFLRTFQDWLKENVGRVIVINIISHQKVESVEDLSQTTTFEMFTEIFSKPVENMFHVMDYHQGYYWAELISTFGDQLVAFDFEYIPEKKNEKAAMGLHLTTREKRDVIQSMASPTNEEALQKLMLIFGEGSFGR